jgi:hypothetical protein
MSVCILCSLVRTVYVIYTPASAVISSENSSLHTPKLTTTYSCLSAGGKVHNGSNKLFNEFDVCEASVQQYHWR